MYQKGRMGGVRDFPSGLCTCLESRYLTFENV
jgi:hypothetical protein